MSTTQAQERDDLALLVARMAYRLRTTGEPGTVGAAGNKELADQAVGYLKRHGLTSPLREDDIATPPSSAAPAETGPVPARPAPAAFVPVHPRFGVLWSDTFPSDRDASESRPRSYPLMALYSAPPAAENEDAALLDAMDALIEAQDALDNREINGINADNYFVLLRRRNAARKHFDAVCAARKDGK